jgi:hypothetical protein
MIFELTKDLAWIIATENWKRREDAECAWQYRGKL